MKEIQRVIEGKVIPETTYSAYPRPLKFKVPSKAAAARSMAPLSVRTEQALKRLDWPERNTERIMAEVWEALCIPENFLDLGRTPINAIVGEDVEPSERDVQIINSTIQWLGTNVGQTYLVKLIRIAQIRID